MPDAPIRIAINGFGRIGRTLLRILLREAPDIELVLINEIEPLETCAYLFEYDSVFGPWRGEVRAEVGGPHGALVVDGFGMEWVLVLAAMTLPVLGLGFGASLKREKRLTD